MSDIKELDQFYTKEKISSFCVNESYKIMNKFYKEMVFLEPSAGSGSFISSIKKSSFYNNHKILSFDIDPKEKSIIKRDFLEIENSDLNNISKDKIITIGNPPFGKRSKLAISFFNKAAEFSDTICFIVPLQFKKWSVHSKLNKDFELIYSEDLPKDSFTFGSKEYGIRTCFQIWTRIDTGLTNKRILTSPETKHPDLEIYQHNNTKDTLKFFDKDVYKWDFAVHRQGYYDYNVKYTDPKKLETNKQYMFIKALNPSAKKILNKIDFNELSKLNTTIPGFGKADIIKEYKKLKGK